MGSRVLCTRVKKQSPIRRNLTAATVRALLPVWKFATKTCRFEKMRPLHLGSAHNRPILPHFARLFACICGVLAVLPFGIGWLTITIAQPIASTSVLWMEHDYPGGGVVAAKVSCLAHASFGAAVDQCGVLLVGVVVGVIGSGDSLRFKHDGTAGACCEAFVDAL
jgi:hypothetical protein